MKSGEITLNISPNAVHKLQMGNELVEFSARFGGVARQISVPIANIYALYARETGHGMTFDIDGPKPSVQAKASPRPCPPRHQAAHGASRAAPPDPEEALGRRQADTAPHQVAKSARHNAATLVPV